jgi:hypothetical protein
MIDSDENGVKRNRRKRVAPEKWDETEEKKGERRKGENGGDQAPERGSPKTETEAETEAEAEAPQLCQTSQVGRHDTQVSSMSPCLSHNVRIPWSGDLIPLTSGTPNHE